MEITEEDKQIAFFLGSDNEILGCFIRGLITICIEKFNAQRTKEFNQYIDEYKTTSNEMLAQKHFEMNEWIRLKEEDWHKKEEYYFKNTSIKAHQIQTELGTVDQEDRERIKREKTMEKCRQSLGNTLEEDSETEELLGRTWDNRSNTSSDDGSSINKTMINRYNSYNKASPSTNKHMETSTNKNKEMQQRNVNGNFKNPRDQSITMAITEDHDMGELSKKSKDSIHKPKTADDLKYFTGLFTCAIRD
ncbi:hypothetical protein RhiirA5_384364 [Rhizophagus irregularis]|uniref:Uncharacterized protein n=1 Tax=Rhizophagus irregularis TaxID=588596 RepID=A0A2N0NTF8_9GLOM|nr:hypothetical protein RhiirA5_384364 [Rhizophagus irregularis]